MKCGRKQLEMKWAAVGRKYDWEVKPPYNEWVRVVAKADDNHLFGLNDFIIKHVVNNFFYTKLSGWLLYIHKKGSSS